MTSLNSEFGFDVALDLNIETDIVMNCGSSRAVSSNDGWHWASRRSDPAPPITIEPQPLYRRFVPGLEKTISFRNLVLERDFERFFEWQHQPRVARFWGLNKSRTEVLSYLCTCLESPHERPLIVEIDGEAAGYVETYWTAQDPIARFYQADRYDRGFHILIGNTSCLGFANTDAVLKSICDHLFSEDPRTQRLIAEPRADNRAILKYIETFTAWQRREELQIDGHRHILLECRRDTFLAGGYLETKPQATARA